MVFGVVWGVIDKGSLGAERYSEAGVLIRVLAKPKSSPFGQPAAVLSAPHPVEATYSIQLSYGCVRGEII